MITLNIETAIEQIKNATDKESIEKITNEVMEYLNNRIMSSGKNKGQQIAEKTFLADRTKFVKTINEIENVPNELKSKYGDYENHHAVTVAYQFKYHKNDGSQNVESVENVETIENVETVETKKPTPKTPKKAVTLDAQKLIDLAVSWLNSDSPYVIGLGVALLTGRRQSEIYFYSSFKADDENTMIVQYLSKKRGENYNHQFRIPVLCNSDLIENAVEKIRKLLPMQELLEIVNNSKNIELGLKTARDKFNNSYSSQILKIYKEYARHEYQDCENKENENDKDYFHGIRATYASIFYHLIQEKYQCSVHDSINYVKHCLSHDTDGIAQKYTEFRFKNLPSVDNFEDSIFSIDNICEVPLEIKEDVKIELNISELMQKLDINSQLEFSKKLASGEKIENILSIFIMKATQAMMISQGVGNTNKKSNSRDKLGNLILSMLQHNYNQEKIENEQDRLYIAINSSSVNLFSKEVTGKAIDKQSCIDTINRLQDKIDDCNHELRLFEKLFTRTNPITKESELTNLHLRNKAKMDIVVKSILDIYVSQYDL